MPKITSKDCVQFIIDNEIPSSTPKEWKRINKHKEGVDIVRVFHNEYRRVSITVYERDGVLRFGERKEIEKEIPTLVQLQANKIKVDFAVRPSKSKGFSGRVLYALGDDGLNCYNAMLDAVDCSEKNDGSGHFAFYCGPEDEEGYLNDHDDGGVDKKLAALFSDVPKMDVGAAESYHTVNLIPGVSAKDLWDVIVCRLELSGAIKMES